MKITRRQIIARGLANRCANCGGHTLFRPGLHFRINERCEECGMPFNRGEGFYLGPFVINYTVTVAVFIVPIILLSAIGVIATKTAIFSAVAAAIVIPIALYRRSWSWWLMTYFYFLPKKLPQNHDDLREDREE